MSLTAKQQRFVEEYLIDLNATAAYHRAGYKAKGDAAGVNASRLLGNDKVQEYIQQRMQAREKRTEITQDMVLQRWWLIATADPNELIVHRRVCCRYCFGHDHKFQWVDRAEFERAVKSEKEMAKKGEPPALPSDYGGYGFDSTIRPHPKCPNCRGEGHGDVYASDTRDLSPQGKLLYAGVKQSTTGLEIKMHDQDKALENVARHLGMFKDKLELTGEMVVFKGEGNLSD